MNLNFIKALHLLERDRIEDAEICLKKAMKESTDKLELLQIHSCSAELFYQLGRYDDALENIEYVLQNTEDYLCPERDTAFELKRSIESETGKTE